MLTTALAAGSGDLTASTWMAVCAVVTLLIVIIGLGIRTVSHFTRLVDSVDRLNGNIEKITSSVGDHEHRISMLEGSEHNRDMQT